MPNPDVRPTEPDFAPKKKRLFEAMTNEFQHRMLLINITPIDHGAKYSK